MELPLLEGDIESDIAVGPPGESAEEACGALALSAVWTGDTHWKLTTRRLSLRF